MAITTRITNFRRYRYLHIGDSHTQGNGDYKNSVTGTRDLTFSIALASGGVLEAMGNGGIGGQPSTMVASRILRALKLKPDLFGVTVGTNDAIILGSASAITASLDKIKRAADDAQAVWFVTTIPPNNNASYQATILAINTAIRNWAADKKVRCVDIYPQLVAGDGVSYQTNYSFDGTHMTSKTSFMISQFIWSQVADMLPPKGVYRAAANDPGNLIFAPIANTGAPAANNVKDPLLVNHRSFTQNGFTVDLPYLFGTQYSAGTPPTITSSLYSSVAGVQGNVWALTVTPNGAGAYYAESGSSNRIDVSDFQGRRLRIGFLLGMSGFGVDNTDARLAGNGDVPLSGFGLTVSFYDADGTIINTAGIADPVDTTGTVNGASGSPVVTAVPLDTQFLPFSQGSTAGQWMVDHGLLPMFGNINVPAGAVGMNFKYQVAFIAGATAPVTVSLAEFSVLDIGPIDMPETPVGAPFTGTRRLSAAATLRDNDAFAIGVYRLDATAAAFTTTLPAAKVAAGRTLVFKKIDASANAATVKGAGSETIDGSNTLALSTQWQTARLYSNGKTWDVI